MTHKAEAATQGVQPEGRRSGNGAEVQFSSRKSAAPALPHSLACGQVPPSVEEEELPLRRFLIVGRRKPKSPEQIIIAVRYHAEQIVRALRSDFAELRIIDRREPATGGRP
jgi:hypothetical protein